MRKLVLGIFVVACLQLGFIAYVTSDKTGENLGFNNMPRSIQSPRIPSPEEDESIEIAPLYEDPILRREEYKLGTTKTTKFIKSGYRTSRKYHRGTRTRGFRTQPHPTVPKKIIITYAVYEPYKFAEREPSPIIPVDDDSNVNKSEEPELPIVKLQKSDGNPFVKVLKKPFTWLKALGSKAK